MRNPPAELGASVATVDTPALLIDLDSFEHDLDLMAKQVAAKGLRLRPHAKTHKCAEIALRQMSRGAVGVCCQKVSEAEALVAGGVNDVLVSNEIVDLKKIERLAQLGREAHIGVCVDNLENIAALSDAAARAGVTLDVLIEIDVGGHRCGIAHDGPVVEFAKRIQSFKSLRFRGIHAYHGKAQHVRGRSDREAIIRESSAKAKSAVEKLSAAGIEYEIITGGGTGTYAFEMESNVYNEVQPGSYIFMDADYSRNDFTEPQRGFKQSLFVLSQVMSATRLGMAVVDAGLKAFAFDSGPPLAVIPGVHYEIPSDDHGVLSLEPGVHLQLGQKLRFIPGHCDPTVNLYDWFVGVRGDRVETLWPIARGTTS